MFKNIDFEKVANSTVIKGYAHWSQALAITGCAVLGKKLAKKVGFGKAGQTAAAVAGGFGYSCLIAKCEKMADQASAELQDWLNSYVEEHQPAEAQEA